MGTLSILFNIRANAAQAQAAFAQAQKALQSYANAMEQIVKSTGAGANALTSLAKSAKTSSSIIQDSFARVHQTTSSLISKFTELGRTVFFFSALVNAVRGLSSAFTAAGSAIVSANVHMETAINRYIVLLGTAEKSMNRIGRIQEINLKSPFELQELIEADTQLQIFGARSQEMLSLIADAAAAVIQPVQQVAFWIGRLNSGDTGEAIMRLNEMGVVTRDMLRLKGIKFDEGNTLLSSVSETMDAVKLILTERFEGAAERFAHTWAGITSNIKDRLSLIQQAFGSSTFEELKTGLQEFLTVLQQPQNIELASFLGAGFGDALYDIIQGLKTFGQIIGSVFRFAEGVAVRFAGSFAGALGVISEALAPLRGLLTALFQGDFRTAFNIVSEGLRNIAMLFVRMVQALVAQMFSGGTNIITSFASGIAAGFGAVVSAVTSIANVVADFLRGGSPTKRGPLSTIDEWFGPVIDAYLAGWTEADFSALDDLSSSVLAYLKEMVEKGEMLAQEAIDLAFGVGDKNGIEALIASIVDEVVQTGEVNQTKLEEIVAMLGEQGKSFANQLTARLDAAALSKAIQNAQAELRKLSDPEAERQLRDALAEAEDQIRKARNIRESRAAQEQLKALRQQQSANEKSQTAAQKKLDVLRQQEEEIKDQISGYEAIERISKRELDFRRQVLEIEEAINRELKKGEKPTDEEAEAEARRKAAFRYSMAIADNQGKLALLNDELGRTEQGSTEYYDLLIQIHTLEEQMAADRARAAQDEAKAMQARADAQWDYEFSLADEAKRMEMLQGKIQEVGADTTEGYRLRTQLAALQQAREKAELESAERLAEAQWEYEYALAGTAERLDLLKQKRNEAVIGSAEWYEIATKIAALETEQADEAARAAEKEAQRAKALADAQFAYQLSTANTAGKVGLVEDKLKGVQEGTEEWYELSTQLFQLKAQQAEEEARAAEKAASEAEARRQAELDYQLAISDTGGKLAILRGELGRYEEGSQEWYRVRSQIYALEQQQIQEAERAAEQATRDAEAAEREAQAILDARISYLLTVGRTSEAIDLLKQKLGGLDEGTAEYYATLAQIFTANQKLSQDNLSDRKRGWENEEDAMSQFFGTFTKSIEDGKKRWDEWKAKVDESRAQFTKMREDFEKTPVGSWVKWFADGLKELPATISRFGTGINDAFTALFDGVDTKNWQTVLGERLYTALNGISVAIEKWVTDNLPWIGEQAARLFTEFVNWFEKNGPEIGRQLGLFTGYFVKWLAELAGAIAAGAGVLIEGFWDWWTHGGKEEANRFVKALNDTIVEFLLGVWEIAGPTLRKIDKALGQMLDELIRRGAEALKKAVVKWWTGLWSPESLPIFEGIGKFWEDGFLSWFNPESLDKDVKASVTSAGASIVRFFKDRMLSKDEGFPSLSASVISSLTGFFGDLRQEFFDWLNEKGEIFAELTGFIKKAQEKWQEMLDGIVAAMVPFAADLLKAFSTDGIDKIFAAIIRATSEFVSDFVGFFVGGPDSLVTKVKDAFLDLALAVVGHSIVPDMFDDINEEASDFSTDFNDIFEQGFNSTTGLVRLFSNTTKKISDDINEKWEDTKKKTEELWTGKDSIRATLTDVWNNTSTGIKRTVATASESVLNLLGTDFGKVLTDTKAKWDGVDSVRSVMKDVWENTSTGLRHIVNSGSEFVHKQVTENFLKVKDDTESKWDTGPDSIRGTIESAWTTIKNYFSESEQSAFYTSIMQPFVDAAAAIGGVFWDFMDAMVTQINNGLQAIKDFGTGVLNVVRTIASILGSSWSPEPVEVTTVTIPPKPSAAARGTLFAKAGAYIVGEEGPELLVPGRGAKILSHRRSQRLLNGVGEGPKDGSKQARSQKFFPEWLTNGFAWLWDSTVGQLSSPVIGGSFGEAIKDLIAEKMLGWAREMASSIFQWATSLFGGGEGTEPSSGKMPEYGSPSGEGWAAAGDFMVGRGWVLTQDFYNPPGHHGLDFAVPTKTPLRSLTQGVVVASGTGRIEGNYIIVRAPNGQQFYYGHMLNPSPYRYGASVNKGAVIGLVDTTGKATGPHVHFEQRTIDGYSIDPKANLHQFAKGGLITEEILGMGLKSGDYYRFGEDGTEAIIPLGDEFSKPGNGNIASIMEAIRRAILQLAEAVALSADTQAVLVETLQATRVMVSEGLSGALRLAIPSLLDGKNGAPLAYGMGDFMFAPEITINGSNLTEDQLGDMITERLAREREALLRQVVALRGRR